MYGCPIIYVISLLLGQGPPNSDDLRWSWCNNNRIKCTISKVVVASLLSRVQILQPYVLEPARLLCAWNSPSKNTGMGYLFLLQGIFQTQGSNLGLLHYRQILYHWATKKTISSVWFSWVQSLSRLQLFVTPWTAAHQASPSITNSQSLLKLMSIESVMASNHLILCRPLLLLPAIFPSIRVFSNESVLCIRWPKYCSFSFSISPSKEYSGLISFRIDWFGLLAVQGTLKSLLQHHNSKASVLRCSAFLWSNTHIHTWLLEKQWLWLDGTFICTVMSLLFDTLSRFVIVFIPRSKRLLISCLQSPSAMVLELKRRKSVCHCCQCFPIYLLWNDGTKCHALSFF